jgi:hypothetical protein
LPADISQGETTMQNMARAIYRLIFAIATYLLHNGRP